MATNRCFYLLSITVCQVQLHLLITLQFTMFSFFLVHLQLFKEFCFCWKLKKVFTYCSSKWIVKVTTSSNWVGDTIHHNKSFRVCFFLHHLAINKRKIFSVGFVNKLDCWWRCGFVPNGSHYFVLACRQSVLKNFILQIALHNKQI